MEGLPAGHGAGHLDVEDLDAATARAIDLDAPDEHGRMPEPETLEGPDSPTWGERLEAAGVTPYVRRHRSSLTRVGVVVLLVGLVAGGALTAHVVNEPPVDDGQVWATAADTATGGDDTAAVNRDGSLQFSYTVTPKRSGDSLRLLGLVGPGVGLSSAHEQVRAAPGRATVGDLVVIPGCDDPTITSARWNDYRLRVLRTDDVGRGVVGLVDVPPGSGAQWLDLIGRGCAQRWFDESITTESVEVKSLVARADSLSVELGLNIHNGLADDVLTGWTSFNQVSWGAVDVSYTDRTLVAGRTTQIQASLHVVDCGPLLAGAGTSPTAALGLTGLMMDGAVVSQTGQGDQAEPLNATVRVLWSPSERARIDTLLRSACAGASAVSVDVASTSAASGPTPPDVQQTGLSLPGPALRMGISVASRASRVVMADSTGDNDPGAEVLASLTSTPVALHGGRATIDAYWSASCYNVASPPFLRLSLTSAGREYPARLQLNDSTLAAGYLRMCPSLTRAALVDAGWSAVS